MNKKIDYEAIEERDELFSEMIASGSFSFEEKRRSSEGNFRYPLQEVLLIWLCAMICGFKKYEDIEWFGEIKINFFKKFFSYENGYPSKSTIARVIGIIDPSKMNDLLLATLANLQIPKEPSNEEYQTIAIDGKTNRGVQITEENKQKLHTVSAFDTINGVTLTQTAVPDKTNEITAIKSLLQDLAIEKKTITIDAIGTQKEIVSMIRNRKGHYILAVKENQKTLFRNIKSYFENSNNGEDIISYEEHDKGHGRIEKRIYCISDQIELIKGEEWTDLQSIIMVKSERTIKGVTTISRRFFITDHAPDAQQLANAIRSHWGIESMHWLLDVIFGEDDRIIWNKIIAENETIVRRLAINLLKNFRETFRRRSKKTKTSYELLQKILFAEDDKLEALLRSAFK